MNGFTVWTRPVPAVWGGTGLGLAIAKEIIDHHKGKIEIDSVYKKGTLVSFTLPPVTGGKKHE